MKVTNKVLPGAEQAAAFFGGEDDGAFVMVNLLKFNETTLKNLPLHEELLDWIHTAPNPVQKSA